MLGLGGGNWDTYRWILEDFAKKYRKVVAIYKNNP
jgi:hypothetical protein